MNNYSYFHLTNQLVRIISDNTACRNLGSTFIGTLSHCTILMAPVDFTLKVAERICYAFHQSVAVSKSRKCSYVWLFCRLAAKRSAGQSKEIVNNPSHSTIHEVILAAIFYHLTTPDFTNIKNLIRIVLAEQSNDPVLHALASVGKKERPQTVGSSFGKNILRKTDPRFVSDFTKNRRESKFTEDFLDELIDAKCEFAHGKKMEVPVSVIEAKLFSCTLAEIADEIAEALATPLGPPRYQVYYGSCKIAPTLDPATQSKLGVDNSCEKLAICCRSLESSMNYSNDVQLCQSLCIEAMGAVSKVYERLRMFLSAITSNHAYKKKEMLNCLEILFKTICAQQASFHSIEVSNLSAFVASLPRSYFTRPFINDCFVLSLKVSTLIFGISSSDRESFTYNGSKVEGLIQICEKPEAFFNAELSMRTDDRGRNYAEQTEGKQLVCKLGYYFQRNEEINGLCLHFEKNKPLCLSLYYSSILMACADLNRAVADLVCMLWESFLAMLGVSLSTDFFLERANLSSVQCRKIREQDEALFFRELAFLVLTAPNLDNIRRFFKTSDTFGSRNKVAENIRDNFEAWGKESSVRFISSILYGKPEAPETNQEVLNAILSIRATYIHCQGLRTFATLTFLDALFIHLACSDCASSLFSKFDQRSSTKKPNIGNGSLFWVGQNSFPFKILKLPENGKQTASRQFTEAYIPTTAVSEEKSVGEEGVSAEKVTMTEDRSDASVTNNRFGNESSSSISLRKDVAELVEVLTFMCLKMEEFGVLKRNPNNIQLEHLCKQSLDLIAKLFCLLRGFIVLSEENNQITDFVGDDFTKVTAVEIFDGVTKASWASSCQTTSAVLENIYKSSEHCRSKQCFIFKSKNICLSYFEIYHLSLRMKAFKLGVSIPPSEDHEDESDLIFFRTLPGEEREITGLQVAQMRLYWRFVNNQVRKALIQDC